MKADRVELHHVLEKNLAAGRWTTCDCGCLIKPDELCPNCVIPWIRTNNHPKNRRAA